MNMLVLIPTLNEAASIGAVVERLCADKVSAATRIVVVDGGSIDGTQNIVAGLASRFPNLSLIANPARIQSAGLNLAFEKFGAVCDMVVRCDAHARYPRAFLAALVKAAQESNADSVVVSLETIGETCFQRALAWTSNGFVGTGGAAHRSGGRKGYVDHGHHAAFTADIFRRTGGYDTTFAHNEDAELDCRIRALGGRIYHAADIKVGYLPRRNLLALGRQYFRYGAGRWRTVRRHPSSLRLRQFAVPLHVLLFSLSLAGAAISSLCLAYPASYASVLILYAMATGLQRRSACATFIPFIAATMHFTWGAGFLWRMIAQREDSWRAASSPGAPSPRSTRRPTGATSADWRSHTGDVELG